MVEVTGSGNCEKRRIKSRPKKMGKNQVRNLTGRNKMTKTLKEVRNLVTLEQEILGMLGRERVSLRRASRARRISQCAAGPLFAVKLWWAP